MARIGSVGEVCLDLYLPEGIGRSGGIAANFAVHAARAGAESLLFGAVGDDEDGARLREWLAALPLDASAVRTLPGSSTVQRLRVEAGERVFCGYDPGVALQYQVEPPEEARLAALDAIACSDGVPRLLEACCALGRRVVCDFSRDTDGNEPGRPDLWLAPWVDRLAVAFVGGDVDFASRLAGLASRVDTLLVLTAGPAGAFAFHRGTRWFHASVADVVVDTNGCGDAFQGAFTAAWVAGAPVEVALRAGAERAAAVAAEYGAQSG